MTTRSNLLDLLPESARRNLSELRRNVLGKIRNFWASDTINHRGIRIALVPSMGEGPLQALREGNYEGGELSAIERFIKQDDVVLELGTGIGFIALFCAKIVGEESVYTFKANPELEPLIRRNFELNKTYPKITFAVLGESNGEVDFNLEPEYWSSSRLKRSEKSRSLKVKQLAVNEVISRIKPSMIVMDIEGGEYELLPHMNLRGVKRFMIEIHPYLTDLEHQESLERRMHTEGFRESWAGPNRQHFLYERD